MCNNYCIKCACKVPVFFGHRRVLIEHGSIKATVDEEYAICQYCGEEIYDPKVNDSNVKARERAMDEALKEQLKGEINIYEQYGAVGKDGNRNCMCQRARRQRS